MFDWNATFENESKQEILNILSKYKDKLVFVKTDADIEKYLEKLM